jgi:hypothetical protein
MGGTKGERMSNAQTPMPCYQSHKKVWALKIESVEYLGSDTTTDENPIVKLHFVEKHFAPREFNLHSKPKPDTGWYMVQYEDGYISFSPAAAFEEGYTKL